MRSMRSRVPEKSELAAQLKRYRYDAGLKGDEAGAVIGKKATTVYKYEPCACAHQHTGIYAHAHISIAAHLRS